MEVKITSIENIGEALLVTGVVDKKPVCATVKSKLMFDDPERGILDILRRIASQPPVEEVKGEKVEGEEPVAVRVPDAARVASVKALEMEVKGKVYRMEVASSEEAEVEVRK